LTVLLPLAIRSQRPGTLPSAICCRRGGRVVALSLLRGESMTRAFVFAAVAGLAVASSALAVPVDKNYSRAHDPALTLADAGAAPGVTTSSLTVNEAGLIATMDYVYIDISHTWVGDLLITLSGPGGASVALINRPGVPANFFGNSDNLDGVYFFEMGGLVFPEDASEAGLVPQDIYAPVDNFSRFFNTQKQGEWTLTITDFAGGDSGVLRGWGFGVTNIPAPGALALMGLGGLAAARRRR